MIEKIRKVNNGTLDESLIEKEYKKLLCSTVFMPIGNPSESGAHILYFFRQENRLAKKEFASQSQMLKMKDDNTFDIDPKYNNKKYFIFVDDFCGSGHQVASDYSHIRDFSKIIKQTNRDAEIWYLTICSTKQGLDNVKKAELFDHIETVILLDETYKCFSDVSRYFEPEQREQQAGTKLFCEKYGFEIVNHHMKKDPYYKGKDIETLAQRAKLGFEDCQLLLGFYHNTPNNTLPIFWGDGDNWKPIFKRYQKIYEQ